MVIVVSTKMKNIKIPILCGLICLASITLAQQNYVELKPEDTKEDIIRKAAHVRPTKRQLKWQELEVTGFIHYGINTFTGKEWGDGKEDPKLFNPKKQDAEQWVKIAKKAGIKLLILTAKHHDGFCLWPTATTEHSIKNSPYLNGQGDVMKELSDACRKHGVKFGVYLSPWDQHEAVYGTEAYNDFFVKQLTELLTQYGQVDEVWFDGANGEGPNGKKQEYDFERYYKTIRAIQPEAVIAVMGPDVRWVGTETGYGRDTEWSVVPTAALRQDAVAGESQQDMTIKPKGDMRNSDLGSRSQIEKAEALVWYPAETDVSIRPGWFFHENQNDQVKSPEKLLDIYFNSVGKNGVLLLNIPPSQDGLIHEKDEQALIGWKNLRDQIFANNLLKTTSAKLINQHKEIITKKEKIGQYWTTKGVDTATFVFDIGKEQEFNLLDISEFIKYGQRVEKFELEVLQNNAWTKVASGTTIGSRRILQFNTIKGKHIRLKILESRLNPMIQNIGLYHYIQ